MVWQFDFSEYGTSVGGMWRVARARTTGRSTNSGGTGRPRANQHDAITALELALAEAGVQAARGTGPGGVPHRPSDRGGRADH